MPSSNIGLLGPVTASGGIHDSDVTDDSIRMATSWERSTCPHATDPPPDGRGCWPRRRSGAGTPTREGLPPGPEPASVGHCEGMMQAVRVARYRFRATFGRRWGGLLAIVVLIALAGGLAMGAVAGARRTQSSFPNYLKSTNPSDLIVL